VLTLGEALVTGTSGALSPWFERFGDSATFSCQVVALSVATRLTVVIESKNYGDTDAGVTAGGTITFMAIGVAMARVAGLKELVRFKYTVDFYKSPHDTSGVAHFRALPPAWENNSDEAE